MRRILFVSIVLAAVFALVGCSRCDSARMVQRATDVTVSFEQH